MYKNIVAPKTIEHEPGCIQLLFQNSIYFIFPALFQVSHSSAFLWGLPRLLHDHHFQSFSPFSRDLSMEEELVSFITMIFLWSSYDLPITYIINVYYHIFPSSKNVLSFPRCSGYQLWAQFQGMLRAGPALSPATWRAEICWVFLDVFFCCSFFQQLIGIFWDFTMRNWDFGILGGFVMI